MDHRTLTKYSHIVGSCYHLHQKADNDVLQILPIDNLDLCYLHALNPNRALNVHPLNVAKDTWHLLFILTYLI